MKKEINPEALASTLIGKSKDAAKAIAKESGYRTRTTRENDLVYIVTRDFDLERISFEVDNGLVTSVSFG